MNLQENDSKTTKPEHLFEVGSKLADLEAFLGVKAKSNYIGDVGWGNNATIHIMTNNERYAYITFEDHEWVKIEN